jgi:hypothetical protein
MPQSSKINLGHVSRRRHTCQPREESTCWSTDPGPRIRRANSWCEGGNTWDVVHAGVVPPPRNGAAFAYCPSLGKLLVFGGTSVTQVPNGVTFIEVLSDTWVWDSLKWTRLN